MKNLAVNSLTEEDVRIFKVLAERERKRLKNSTPRRGPEEPDVYTPDTYLAFTPPGGIGARVGDEMESAECEIYKSRQDGADRSIVPAHFSKTIFNYMSERVLGSCYVMVERDKFGTWYARDGDGVVTNTGTASSSGGRITAIEVVTSLGAFTRSSANELVLSVSIGFAVGEIILYLPTGTANDELAGPWEVVTGFLLSRVSFERGADVRILQGDYADTVFTVLYPDSGFTGTASNYEWGQVTHELVNELSNPVVTWSGNLVKRKDKNKFYPSDITDTGVTITISPGGGIANTNGRFKLEGGDFNINTVFGGAIRASNGPLEFTCSDNISLGGELSVINATLTLPSSTSDQSTVAPMSTGVNLSLSFQTETSILVVQNYGSETWKGLGDASGGTFTVHTEVPAGFAGIFSLSGSPNKWMPCSFLTQSELKRVIDPNTGTSGTQVVYYENTVGEFHSGDTLSAEGQVAVGSTTAGLKWSQAPTADYQILRWDASSQTWHKITLSDLIDAMTAAVDNSILYKGSGIGWVALAPGSPGQVLTLDGSSTPSWA